MEFFAGIGLKKNKANKQSEQMKETMDRNTIQTINKINTELKQKDTMIAGLTATIAGMNIEIQKLKK